MSFSARATLLAVTVSSTLVFASGCGIVDQALMATQLQPGACITLSADGPENIEHKVVDCATESESVVYQIILSGEGEQKCEADQEMYFTYEQDSGDDNTLFSACMMPKFTAGSCYADTDSGAVETPCDKAEYKVVESFDSSDAACSDADAVPATYGSANRTYCLTDPAA